MDSGIKGHGTTSDADAGGLAALGADKLAKLIVDEVQQNAPFKRIITAALAGVKGPGAVAGIIDRRLASLERAHGYIDWDKRHSIRAGSQGDGVDIATRASSLYVLIDAVRGYSP